jgi:8-oxo-dGTP diphosphatase
MRRTCDAGRHVAARLPDARCTISTVTRTILVAAAVLVENGRVLLSQRKAGTHLAGAWEFPGGKVEPGEDPRTALRRELREEVGIEAIVGEIVDATFHRYEEAQKSVLLLFFEAEREEHSPEPRPIDVAAIRWALPGELDPALFPAADVSVLRKVVKRLHENTISSARG